MQDLIHRLIEKSKLKTPLLVGVSGINGSGKGYISQKIVQALQARDRRCALIGLDGWLQPPDQRFVY